MIVKHYLVIAHYFDKFERTGENTNGKTAFKTLERSTPLIIIQFNVLNVLILCLLIYAKTQEDYDH